MGTSSSFDGSTVSLSILKKNLAKGLALMSDVVLHPTFPSEELERQRGIYLGRIAQEARQPTATAIKTFQRELFGAAHPYSQPYTGSGTVETIKAITREDLAGFYRANYVANNAALILVGDITLDEARSLAQAAFGSWAQGTVARPKLAAPAKAAGTRIVIVDKPGAAQSVIVAGEPGMARSNPDYVAFDVMNNALGGQFSSRINMNLREDKGYTYGARSFMSSMRESGMFAVVAPVQTQNTRESVVEIIKEMKDVVGPRPLADAEVTDSRENLVKGFPQDFQTDDGIARKLGAVVLYDLPDNEWSSYVGRVQGVTGDMASTVARRYIDPGSLLVVIVGDRAKIEDGLRGLALGEVTLSAAK
jgi:zinc protease